MLILGGRLSNLTGDMSSETRITYGTPQGSVVEPLIYMNDFVNACEHIDVNMYADDTT